MITVSGVLSSAVAPAGTFTVTTPVPYDTGRFQGGLGHVLEMNGSPLQAPVGFSVSYSGNTVTITNKTTGTWAAGYGFTLQLNQPGDAAFVGYGANSTTQTPLKYLSSPLVAPLAIASPVAKINFGAPAAKSATAVLNASAAFQTVITNVLAAPVTGLGGCAGRALQVVSSSASDTAKTITIVGTDIYGVTLTQTLTMNGTTAVNGTKAFNTITSISVSALMIGTISVGTLDVFGLPVPLAMIGDVIQDLTDGAKSGTAGTFVVADTTSGGSTAATGDVRGTYAPNVATNGVHYYHLIMVAPDFYFPGEPQA